MLICLLLAILYHYLMPFYLVSIHQIHLVLVMFYEITKEMVIASMTHIVKEASLLHLVFQNIFERLLLKGIETWTKAENDFPHYALKTFVFRKSPGTGSVYSYRKYRVRCRKTFTSFCAFLENDKAFDRVWLYTSMKSCPSSGGCIFSVCESF